MDELIIRGRLRVYELLLSQIRATNGNVFVTSAGKVSALSGSGVNTFALNFEDNIIPFAVDDLIRAQRFTGTGTYQVNATVTGLTGSTLTVVIDPIYDSPTVGMDFVRLGNTTDTDRQGSIYLTADDSNAPCIDVKNGVTTFSGSTNAFNSFNTTKVRLGRLSGITDPDYGVLSGYGLYSDNVYLKGGIVATSGSIGGWAIDADSISKDSLIVISSADKSIRVGDESDFNVKMFYSGSDNYGIKAIFDLETTFELGSTNQIAGWVFDYEKFTGGTGTSQVGLSSAGTGSVVKI